MTLHCCHDTYCDCAEKMEKRIATLEQGLRRIAEKLKNATYDENAGDWLERADTCAAIAKDTLEGK